MGVRYDKKLKKWVEVSGPRPPEREIPLEQYKEEATQRLVRFASKALAAFVAAYPPEERESWDAKEAEARAVLAGGSPTTILLDNEVALTGETLAVVATKVIANADFYKMVSGKVSGLRRATVAAIDSATTPDEIEVVLAATQSHAEAMIASALSQKP